MKTARLYRMVTPEHICPFGVKAKYLLEKKGYEVEDHWLRSTAEADQFRAEHQVKTTPQAFIQEQRVGGYTDLRAYFGLSAPRGKDQKTYFPVLSLFATAALMALAVVWSATRSVDPALFAMLFGGLSMCLLAVQKFRDLEAFTNGFVNYDLLSQKFVPYAYSYPFAEALAGIGMLSGLVPVVTGGIALFIGAEGAASVIKAVYFEKRDLRCACMGGDTNVPLGFVSLLENLLMVAMGIWMLGKIVFV